MPMYTRNRPLRLFSKRANLRLARALRNVPVPIMKAPVTRRFYAFKGTLVGAMRRANEKDAFYRGIKRNGVGAELRATCDNLMKENFAEILEKAEQAVLPTRNPRKTGLLVRIPKTNRRV